MQSIYYVFEDCKNRILYLPIYVYSDTETISVMPCTNILSYTELQLRRDTGVVDKRGI